MSHFPVLVIGNNPEELLQPYHEYECTGCNDEYVQDIDITDEVLFDIENANGNIAEVLSNHGLENCIVESESEVFIDDDHKYGYAIVKDGKLIKAVRRTNPNKKWDWYELGGRWSNFFKLKSGGFADSATKSDIDFDGMANDAKSQAKAEYARFSSLMLGMEFPKSWSEMKAEQGQLSHDELREKYHAQPAVKVINSSDMAPWMECAFDYYGKSEESFIEKQAAKAFVTYAMLQGDEWSARGEMGWFGISNDNVSEREWSQHVLSFIHELPDDALLSIYDCHI